MSISISGGARPGALAYFPDVTEILRTSASLTELHNLPTGGPHWVACPRTFNAICLWVEAAGLRCDGWHSTTLIDGEPELCRAVRRFRAGREAEAFARSRCLRADAAAARGH